MKWIVVGAGFFGTVIAERIANDLGQPVTVIEKRDHIGGNCGSARCSETGIEIHRYGSHIFHTSNEMVWNYISRFTTFNRYQHRVLTRARGQVYPMPINQTTINRFYGLNLSSEEVATFIEGEAAKEKITEPRNLEEKAVSLVGRPLYETFIKGYTLKQWEKDPLELSADIMNRLPVRCDENDRYFSDSHEGIPLNGYTAVFERMLDHPLIDLNLNTDFFDIKNEFSGECTLVFTGPLDRFFNYKYGRLDWRTLDFKKTVHFVSEVQPVAVMNEADGEVPYTRIHEYKHYHPERPVADQTVTFKEFSRTAGDRDEPYYPVDTERNRTVLKMYQQEAATSPDVIFGGRLGTYRYLDMDDTIEQALDCYASQIKLRVQDRV